MPSLPKPRLRRSARARADGNALQQAPPEPRVEVVEHGGLRWINIERPTPVDRGWLEEHFDFHPLDYEDVQSRNQRPKIDEYPDYLFIVLHFPRFDKRAGRLQAAELNLFVAEDLMITLPNEPLKPLSALWSRCERSEAAREQYMGKGPGFLLYEIVDTMYDYCFPILDKIGFKLDLIEDALFEGESDDLVRDISNTKQEIINYRRIVKPQRTVLRLLDRSSQRFAPTDLDIYFDDIVDKSERIWDLLENYKEVAEALEATNESVISHRVNDILRALTAISVIVLPLTLIASVFGMNVGLPGGGDPAAGGSVTYWVIVGALLAILIGMVAYFRFTRWL